MDRGDIPEVLFSSIKEDDPYRASKLLQIERWCYAHWNLHAKSGKKGHNFLAQVLSDKECWEKVDGLHGVKLNRQTVGKKLITPPDSCNPFSEMETYKIACRCCLEEDIIKMFENRKQERNVENEDSLKRLVSNLSYGDPLKTFWSHLIGGYISELNLKGRHPYEYGLDCAIDWKQAEAVEFFWNKIKSLPEDELSVQRKDEIFMKNAVYTAGGRFSVCPDIFEFFFNQINPDRYPELLRRDLEKNGHYGSLNKMKDMLNFDKSQELFDCLKPGNISEDYYHLRLECIEIQNYPEYYVDAATKLFMHIWTKEGFDSHRALVINKEVMDSSAFFHKNLLVRWVEKGCMEPVWAVLDKLDSSQIKKFMTYKQADYIRSMLEQGDNNSLNKFLSYGKSINKNLDRKSIPGPSGNLAEVEVRKTHGQFHIGLSK